MDDGPAASELAEIHRRLASAEATIANLHEGQRLQQQGMEGLQAALAGRIQALEEAAGLRGLETILGLALEGLHEREIESRPYELAETPTARSIVVNRRVLAALEWQVRRRVAYEDDSGVLQVARAAGDWSCMHHPGMLASEPIERALQRSGARLVSGLEPWSPGTGRRRVLHVMTLAHAIGGHTRLAERWMRLDRTSMHSLVLTEQGELDVPPALGPATEGRVHTLAGATAIERVVELARVARASDLVVLHIHPYDAVAVAALGDPVRRPPTVLVDHGDHLFWLGVGAADAIVSVRPSGAALVTGRRGVPADRDVVIPLPLDPVTRRRTRAEARLALGLPADAQVLLTIASAHKYAEIGDASFTELVGRALDANPRAVLVAIGPDTRTASWSALATRFPGRVQANGPSPETEVAREAADVYLDSFPFGSPTSLFEAALYETPAVVLRPPGVGVLAVEDPDVELVDAIDGASWVDAVSRLLRDDDERAGEGSRIAAGLRASHAPERIAAQIAEVSAGARRGAAATLETIPELVTPFDVALAAWQEASGLGRSVEDTLAAHGLLPNLA